MPSQQAEDPIVEVWSTNIDEEFKRIRKIIKKYKYVSMVCNKASFCIYETKISPNFCPQLYFDIFV